MVGLCGQIVKVGEWVEYLFGIVEVWVEQWYVVYLDGGEFQLIDFFD